MKEPLFVSVYVPKCNHFGCMLRERCQNICLVKCCTCSKRPMPPGDHEPGMNHGFGNNVGKVLSAGGTGQYRYPRAEHFALAVKRDNFVHDQ